MIGFFVCLNGLFSVMAAPFGAMGSVAGGIVQNRSAQRALVMQEYARDQEFMSEYRGRTKSFIRVHGCLMARVNSPPHIPRVEKRK